MGIADWGITTELVSRRGFLCRVVGSVFRDDDNLWTFTSLNLKTEFTCKLSAVDGVLPALLVQARHELQQLLVKKTADAESPFCQPAELVRGHRITLFIPVYEPVDGDHALSALVLPRVNHCSKLDEGGRYLYHDNLKLRTAVCINGELISDSGNKCTAAIIYGPFDIAGDPGA